MKNVERHSQIALFFLQQAAGDDRFGQLESEACFDLSGRAVVIDCEVFRKLKVWTRG